MKNLSEKQLLDIISLSILAANTESDPTKIIKDNKFYGETSTNTPYIQELLFILNENNNEEDYEIQSFAISANEHIAAIRLGMKAARKSVE